MQIKHIRVLYLIFSNFNSYLCLLHITYMASPPSPSPASFPPPSSPDEFSYVCYISLLWGCKNPKSTTSADIWGGFLVDAADYLTLACFGVFSFLIGLDVWRAFRKRAAWLPGKAFALSGVTVQLIVWWTSLNNVNSQCKGNLVNCLYYHQLVVSGRVAVCVFIGYLLPGMADPSVRAFLALAITICAQIASELFFLTIQPHRKNMYDQPDNNYMYIHPYSDFRWKPWSKFVDLILLICIIVLGLILGCTILASKTIHGLLRQRISAVFSITEEDEFQFSNESTMPISWNDFEDEVLRSWFVARSCQADYVISRSVFSSAVGIVVTICVIIFLLSNTFRDLYFSRLSFIRFMRVAIFSPLFSFIIIGWVVICWRWLSVQLYFRQHRHIWRRRLCLEDFWTSNTIQLIHMYDLKRDRQQFEDDERSSSKMAWLSKLQSLPTKIFTKMRLHKLLYLVLVLQVSVVFFSKVCGLLSEAIVGKFVCWCRKHMRKGDPVAVASPENYARILECICMPGEDPSDLWEANKMPLNKVKLLMRKGCEKGRSSEEINTIFSLYSLQWVEDGIQLLNMLKRIAMPSVLKHFPSVEKQSVKMTIVSLITILMRLHKAKSDHLRKVLKACREVWDLLSFADECDIDLHANQISLLDDLNRDKDQICMAADREFYKLQREYDKLSSECEDCVIDVQEARRFLEDLTEKCEGLLKRENLLGDCKERQVVADLRDSKDWMKIAPSYTLYKLCKLMLDENIEDFVAWTEESLRNVIACCVSRLPDMLVKQCWKWAQEFEEDKLWEAIHLAGKCRGMMEAWDLKPKRTLSTTRQWTIQVEESP